MKRFFKVLGIILAIVAVSVGVYAYVVFNAASGLMEYVHVPVVTEPVREEVVDLGADPISILLLGLDEEHGGRSDTMMLVTINPEQDSSYILSIARDSYVYIPGIGTDRLNHAYAYGGLELTINTLQRLLDVPVDFYIEIEMTGFEELIDVVGGITLNNDQFAFSQGSYHFPMGELFLTGSEALAFSRMRMQDPEGDFGRQRRQRQVVETLARQLLPYSLTRFQQIFDALGGNLRTDLTMGDVTNLTLNYSSALGTVNQLDMRGRGQMIRGMAVQVISDEELSAMRSLLRNHLELD